MNPSTRLALIVLLLIASISTCMAANDRPLIYGMNPTPMDWWGYDKYTYDPILFQKMREAGCTSARIGVGWDLVEPVKGTRDWSEFDRWVTYCLDNNIEPLILINSTAEWALPADCDRSIAAYVARYPPGEEYAQDFHDYVYAFVRRYRGRVRYYEFWNEANGYGWYTALQNPPTYSRADQYTPWMIRCYKALKLADPTAQMSTTGIDDGGGGHAAYFLNLIYQYGGKGYFDAVADHPYPAGGNFQSWKLDQIRSTLDNNGDQHVKVWITEFGYDWSSFTSQINYYFNTLTQNHYDYVRIATWHTANEFPWESGFGLLNRYLQPKPEYNTFKNYPKPARPTINFHSIVHLSASSVKVRFGTNVAATSLVMYGLDNNYGSFTTRKTTAGTSHEHIIEGLTPGTTYHFRIRAGAVEDGDAFSPDLTFTTQSGPVVRITSGPTVSEISTSGATVSWTTDVPSTSGVDYGASFSHGSSASDPQLVTQHSVRISGLQSGSNYQFRVRSTAAGYADAVVEGDAFRTGMGYGALVNGGFENGLTGWTFWEVYPWGYTGSDQTVDWPGHIGYGVDSGLKAPTPACVEGSHRATGEAGWVSAVGGLYQTVTTVNGPYIVSGWLASWCDGGEEIVEITATDGAYMGGIPQGVSIGRLTAGSGWVRTTNVVDVTSERLTVATRTSQWSAVNIVSGHFDGISVTPAVRDGIGALKSLEAGSGVVTAPDQVVSAVLDANTLYIQSEDRCSGIRVVTSDAHGASVGDRVAVCGSLALVSGEARIESATVLSKASGAAPKPLAVGISAIGGPAQGPQPAVGSGRGASNTGLLVRVWGEVQSADESGFTITDGSGSTLRCALAGANALVTTGDYVACTGISSCEPSGESVVPVVRARASGDVTEYAL